VAISSTVTIGYPVFRNEARAVNRIVNQVQWSTWSGDIYVPVTFRFIAFGLFFWSGDTCVPVTLSLAGDIYVPVAVFGIFWVNGISLELKK
jgi:hypothetical protein